MPNFNNLPYLLALLVVRVADSFSGALLRSATLVALISAIIQYGGRQTGSSFNFVIIVDRRPVPVYNHRFSTTTRRMVLVLCSADNTFYRNFKMAPQKLDMYMNFTGKSKLAATITMRKMNSMHCVDSKQSRRVL